MLYAPEAEAYLASLFRDDACCDSDGDSLVDVWLAAFARDALVRLAAHSSPGGELLRNVITDCNGALRPPTLI